MRKAMLVTAVCACLLVSVGDLAAKGKPGPQLPAPTLNSCELNEESGVYGLDWTCIVDPTTVTKYVVEVVAIYCSPGAFSDDGLVFADYLVKHFQYTFPAACDVDPTHQIESIDSADFDTLDYYGNEVAPSTVSFRVKGLNVPMGPKPSQNNPFSEWCPAAPGMPGEVCSPASP